MALDQKATSASWGAWPPWPPPLDPPLLSVESLCKVRNIKLLIRENRTLTLMLHHFSKR